MKLKQFKIINQIGSGTSGKVYLVEKKRTKEVYVMKAISLHKIPVFDRPSCIAEIEVLSRLEHPFIVKYAESFIEDLSLYIVMEFCEGGDLHHLIRDRSKTKAYFEESTILKWLAQALIAIEFIHKRHILHRDIKSLNLFLDADHRLRVGDFGVSKILESTLACANTWVGTPYYLSPELCQGTPYAWPSDIWALGCVAFELATLRTPFSSAKSIHDLMRKVQNSKIPQLPPQYSKGLRHIIVCMLRRNPAKRLTATALMKKPLLQNAVKELLKEIGSAQKNERKTTMLKVPKKAQPITYKDAESALSPVQAEKRIKTIKTSEVMTPLKTTIKAPKKSKKSKVITKPKPGKGVKSKPIALKRNRNG